ncbi:hypothetical protein GCM10023231_02680 [Olivibacter ginsenosidimutans]|uniref:Fibronectin type III domain-containing protein n=1 Tax=Olivibacter ginsenosidimutans TaxID=1176537 RepID=A0ABP9AD55_9SPHI
MGRVNNGVNGPVSGKVGSVVFCKWKGIDYIRSLPRIKKHRKPTASQATQRSKFSFMQEKLSPIVPFVRLGFMNYAPNRSGHSSAMSYNLKEAVLEEEHGYQLDHEKFSFSKGVLPYPKEAKATLDNGIIRFTWRYDAQDEKESKHHINLTLLLLYPENEKHQAWGKRFGNSRYDGYDTIVLKETTCKPGAKYHAYIAFFAEDGSNDSSDSVYAGAIEIP